LQLSLAHPFHPLGEGLFSRLVLSQAVSGHGQEKAVPGSSAALSNRGFSLTGTA
jgi:hypothetical protein